MLLTLHVKGLIRSKSFPNVAPNVISEIRNDPRLPLHNIYSHAGTPQQLHAELFWANRHITRLRWLKEIRKKKHLISDNNKLMLLDTVIFQPQHHRC